MTTTYSATALPFRPTGVPPDRLQRTPTDLVAERPGDRDRPQPTGGLEVAMRAGPAEQSPAVALQDVAPLGPSRSEAMNAMCQLPQPSMLFRLVSSQAAASRRSCGAPPKAAGSPVLRRSAVPWQPPGTPRCYSGLADASRMARSSGRPSLSFSRFARSFASMMSSRLAARTTNPSPRRNVDRWASSSYGLSLPSAASKPARTSKGPALSSTWSCRRARAR